MRSLISSFVTALIGVNLFLVFTQLLGWTFWPSAIVASVVATVVGTLLSVLWRKRSREPAAADKSPSGDS